MIVISLSCLMNAGVRWQCAKCQVPIVPPRGAGARGARAYIVVCLGQCYIVALYDVWCVVGILWVQIGQSTHMEQSPPYSKF